MSAHFVVDRAYPLRPDGMPRADSRPVEFIRPATQRETELIEAELLRRSKVPEEVPDSI